MARRLTDFERLRAREWMLARRNELSQDALAKDISKVLAPWQITRDRYSRYESGGTDFGRDLLDKIVAYWKTKNPDEPGPDFTPPAPPSEPVDPQVALARAIERQAAAIERQNALLAGPASDDTPDAGPVSLIESLVEEQRLTRLMLEAVLLRLGGLEPDPEAELRRTWVEERMAEESSRTQLPTPGRLETPAGSR